MEKVKELKREPKKEEKQGQKRQYRTASAQIDAHQRCQAILSLWSERRSPVEVCRELSISWTILNQWQDRALEGMLQALEPRVQLGKGPALSPRLQALLQKKRTEKFPGQRLTDRLKNLQQQNAVETVQSSANKE